MHAPDWIASLQGHLEIEECAMSLAENAKKLAAQARAAAGGNKAKLEKGIRQAAQTLDAKSGGRYHDQIGKLDERAERYVEQLPDHPADPPPAPAAKPEGKPPRS